MHYREFGRTGIRVSEIGVGCGGLGGEGKLGLEPVLERAIALGINFFDTCDTYAETRSEHTLGRVFRHVPREKIVLCSKFGGLIDAKGNWSRDISVKHLHEAFEASCRRLHMDYFDIYLVHTPPRDICRHADLFEALDGMVAQGKIRAYGLSLEQGDFAIEFAGATRGRAIEIAFSLFAQDPRRAFLKTAADMGVGVHLQIAHGQRHAGRLARRRRSPAGRRPAAGGLGPRALRPTRRFPASRASRKPPARSFPSPWAASPALRISTPSAGRATGG